MASRLSIALVPWWTGWRPLTKAAGILPPVYLVLAVTLLSGCDRPAEPELERMRGPERVVDAMGGDPFSAEIRRIKDLLADDRLDEAQEALHALERGRDDLPADRQLEVDRLEALLEVEP